MELSTILEWLEIQKQADEGNRDAIKKVIELSPIGALMLRPKVGLHIYRIASRRNESNRTYLEELAQSFRKGLLRLRQGPPRRVSIAAAQTARTMQSLFDAAPIRIKKRYRNDKAKMLDIRELSRHVASGLPSDIRGPAEEAMIEVLKDKPQTRKGFGDQVAAKLFLCSPRHIRSLRKSQ
jgi:hypothetical protein